ncbi:hypothetical protein [Ralstonia pickettii]|uniref:hypothetical protein n=1 Tax=Ralstonia pickettii TaxID=329 RepID=UPI000158BDAF|nr:hypothetical protein [Ralstonia pickettii]
MSIRRIKKAIYRRFKLVLAKRKKPMLPRKDGQLDASKIERIVVLTWNGKPFLVIAYPSGEGAPFHEPYSAELNSLIIGSGLPWGQEPAPGAQESLQEQNHVDDPSVSPKNKQ